MGDIKKLITNNERLKALVEELEGRIESHNQQVINNDTNIKQQIEILTRQSLSKKTIDWNSQKEIMDKTANEMQAINNKVKRLEMKEFNSSSLLNSVTEDMDQFTMENRTVIQTKSTILAREIHDEGYVLSNKNYENSSYSEIHRVNHSENTFVTNVVTHNTSTNNNVVFTTTKTTRGDTISRVFEK